MTPAPLYAALSVVGVFALNVAIPGASFVLTAPVSAAHGPRAGRLIAVGLSLADTLYAILAFVGVAAALRAHAAAVDMVAVSGGIWLAVLGLKLLDASAPPLAAGAPAPSVAPAAGHTLSLGLAAGLLNPQAIVFFSTVAMASLEARDAAMQAWFLVALVVAIALTSVALRVSIATLMGVPAIRTRYLARHRLMERLSAAALFLLGMKLSVNSMLPWAVKLLAPVVLG